MNSRAGCPTYRISSADPSATWVHLHDDWFAINRDSKIHFILYLKFNQDKYCIFIYFIYFPKSIWNWEGIFRKDSYRPFHFFGEISKNIGCDNPQIII